tara:strand:+ start:1758 stop:2942 length:1185 start_codon:yes stop_codon:yes gene_type:complete
MSEFDLEEITDRAGTGAPNFTHGFNINGSDSGISVFTHTVGTTEPSSPSNGDTWWNTDNDSYNVYIDGEWKGWLGDSYSSTSNYGDRGFVFGDDSSTDITRIQYFNHTSSGNASDFGDLPTGAYGAAGCTNAINAFRLGGNSTTSSYQKTNTIETWVCATTGNATDFGDIGAYTMYSHANSDGTIGIVVWGRSKSSAGQANGDYTNDVERFTMASAGNASDHGDLTYSRGYGGSVANATRMVNFGGYNATDPYYHKDCDYLTMATAGNCVDFGDLIKHNHYCTGVGSGSGDRGLQMGGMARVPPSGGFYTDEIQYVDISTPGNATDSGDLVYASGEMVAGSNNATNGFKSGGYNSGTPQNYIQKSVLATGANATDHGDLLTATFVCTGTSGNAA